jgi:hypothetical protein
MDFPDILVRIMESESLTKLSLSQKESTSNDNVLDPLESVLSYDIFKNESVNPFIENQVIAYHNVGIEKSINFLVSYVFFLNFEGKSLTCLIQENEFGQNIDLFKNKLEKFAEDTKEEKSRFEILSFKM